MLPPAGAHDPRSPRIANSGARGTSEHYTGNTVSRGAFCVSGAKVGNVGMNPCFGPLKGNNRGFFIGVMPSFPAEHQQVFQITRELQAKAKLVPGMPGETDNVARASARATMRGPTRVPMATR